MKNKPVKKSAKPGKLKAERPNYIKFSDVPRGFMEETGYMLADYSVALGYVKSAKGSKPEIFGSGVLVHKGNHFGVLTAHHCVDNPDADFRFGSFGGDKLLLVLKRSHFIALPPEILIRHAFGIPKENIMEPDLAFVEILPSPQLGSIMAINSFLSLDKNPLEVEREFGKIEMPFTVVGFPGVYHQRRAEGKNTRQIIKHMAYFYTIGPKSVRARDGWDYIEAKNWYSRNHELPDSFKGVSGGPVWGLQIKKDKNDGHLSLKKFSLIGIAFLQVRRSKKILH